MGGNKKSFLKTLPSNLPFPKLIRRPDYQLRNLRFKWKNPSINVLFIIILIFSRTFFIYIGGFYYITNDDNITIFTDPITGDPSVIWKDNLDNQTIFEGIAAGTTMSIGASGFYLIHLSSQYSYSPTVTAKYLVIGLAAVG